jgi:uncharacterized membrane protein
MKNIISKLAWLFIIAPAIYLAIIWDRIPQTVAMHYDLQGNPDRYGNKKELIGLTAILIAVNIFVYFLLTNIYRIDPKKYAADNKERLQRIAFAVVIFMSALLSFIIYSSTQTSIKLDAGIIFSGVGLLFAVIGNYLPNLKPNYFAGLRLPWTLENPDNWRKTHALAGRLWFVGGLFIAVICFFIPTVAAIIVFALVMCIITIIPCVYSYRIYKAQKRHP